VSDFDLRLGDYRDVLADVGEVDALITDTPYSERTHSGHNRAVKSVNGKRSAKLSKLVYSSWSSVDVLRFVDHWAPRVRGWFVALTSHDLVPEWARALEYEGRYVFHPIPCVMPGMTVRLTGDGPGSWSVYAVVARPRSAEFVKWGALPGAYVVAPDRSAQNRGETVMGGKPIRLMQALVRDYTRHGDLVCDPCAGAGTTLRAALSLGRMAVGAEIDPKTHAKAHKVAAKGIQHDLFG
jgi:hypothetical protein